ncbi:MAG TPA: beta-propeller domain-containing protein, partial [Lacipirellulaceae bacterium]|nr:beta-propeller domain-containing protein [Lacipirellulaceae bacterium]
QPERIAEYTFEQFSTSEAEVDHHAFGYYSDFGLLAMPVSTAHMERVDLDGDGYAETSQLENDFELAVFSIDVNAADPADRLMLKSEIEHDDTVRRSGFIGDKLYSIANGSIKVVNIADPDTVIAQLTIPQPENPPIFGIIPAEYGWPVLVGVGDQQPSSPVSPLPEDPLTIAIDHSREAFAAESPSASGDAFLVTAEASPSAAGGYSVVLEAHGQNYLYHVDADGLAQLVDSNFHFSESIGAWHAIEARPAHSRPHLAPGITGSSAATQTATSLSLGGDRYFTSLGAGPFATSPHHVQEGLRQASDYSSALSLLVLSLLESNSKPGDHALFERVHDRSQAGNPHFELSDVDDAFDSLENLQLGRRSAVGQLHRR